jgi:cob(I)alamin adenosyltransferase
VHRFNDVGAREAQHFVAALKGFPTKVGWTEVEILYESSESAIKYDDSFVDGFEVGLATHDCSTLLVKPIAVLISVSNMRCETCLTGAPPLRVNGMAREKIYTREGDDGTTGLFYGGRVPKDSELPRAYGAVDEAQAVIGLVRTAAGHGSEVDAIVVPMMKDLYVLMAELATLPENRHKLTPGKSSVTSEMVDRLEAIIDDLDTKFDPPTEFVVPGEHPVSAWLDFARTTVRRAERQAFGAAPPPSYVVPYLNRLSDLLWTMARWQEGVSRPVKSL